MNLQRNGQDNSRRNLVLDQEYLDLELSLLLTSEDNELLELEFSLLDAEASSGQPLSHRQKCRRELLQRAFGEDLSGFGGSANSGTETRFKNGTAATTKFSALVVVNQWLNDDALGDCLAHTLAHTHAPNTQDLNTLKQEAYRQQSLTKNERATPKPRRTRGPQKLTLHERLYKEAIEGMHTLEGAHEFSLNFDIGQEGSFLHSANPAQLFQKRLNRFLREQGLAGLPFAFSFDVTAANKGGRLHAHGSIVLKPDQREAVIKALRNAGGFIKGRAGSRQVVLKASDPNRSPAGWLKYTTEYRAKVKKLFAYEHIKSDEYCGVSTSYRRTVRRNS